MLRHVRIFDEEANGDWSTTVFAEDITLLLTATFAAGTRIAPKVEDVKLYQSKKLRQKALASWNAAERRRLHANH
jgi:hypothetical protein